MYILETIGQNIRSLREQQGIIQEELAYHADVSVSYLSRVEKGTQNFTVDIADRLADALGVYTYELFQESAVQKENVSSMIDVCLQRYRHRIESMSFSQQQRVIQLIDAVTLLAWESDIKKK